MNPITTSLRPWDKEHVSLAPPLQHHLKAILETPSSTLCDHPLRLPQKSKWRARWGEGEGCIGGWYRNMKQHPGYHSLPRFAANSPKTERDDTEALRT